MFDKAVVCTDLSMDSDTLVGCAGALRVLGLREAVLAHVVDVFADPSGSSVRSDLAGELFERQMGMLESCGLAVHVETPVGHPAFSLEEVRKRHGAGLIVIGGYGKGVFSQAFSGSISSDLMQLSETPVLVATMAAFPDGHEPAAVCTQILGNVLYCTDFSETAERAFSVVLGLAGLGAQRFTLAHVQDRERLESETRSAISEYDRRDTVRLIRLREQLTDAGATDVDIQLTYGSPAEELAMSAASGQFSLIVLGSRGRSARRLERALGGVSDRVVRDSKTPLLLIPAPRRDQGDY